MAERLPCEFFLIRYVPDTVKGEFVNIGVVLREAGLAGASGAVPAVRSAVRFTRDWARVRCMDADADTEMLEALEQEVGRRLERGVSSLDPKHVLDTFEDGLSNSIQITEGRATLAENFAAELDQLMTLYVEPLKVARIRAKSGRATISGAIRTEFERAGVWGAMRKRIPAAQYTSAGDPLKIDCGYRWDAGPVVRMFQAVSLEGDVEAAKGLAFSAPQLRDGVERIEGSALELTAVIEALRGGGFENEEAEERYQFGVATLERQAIRVVTVNDLARAAQTARRELGF
ncbi:Protein of unknown function [Granulicella rosea]|uniref:DUF3037 domain-containing protein n=1 Tax=Granulicella rosea TaxID=474952 RepID=A0A239DL18_9BACT|nr:DUF3037 domain-containing protein [Granulicella rosea]SNS33335.1 Protein of unknown function [Granulicella rosea]